MRSTIKRLMVVVISMPVMALTSQPARALSCQDLRDAGDVLRYALPVWAYAMTAGYKDGRGAFQYTKTLVFTGMGTGILKTIGDKSRPRAQTSTESFVSGHVSSAMSGAAFIYTRYGKPFGIPAYSLDVMVGTALKRYYLLLRHKGPLVAAISTGRCNT
jgi:hypothetical protein